MPIDLPGWESIIQKIVEEFQQEQNFARRRKLWADWRRKLETEPPFLKPYEIDAIVRDVRRRLGNR